MRVPSPQPKVLVDIDGVLADQAGPSIAATNKRFDVSLAYNDFTNYWFEEVYAERCGLSVDEVGAFFADLFADPAYISGQPVILPSLAGMRRIAGVVDEIHLVTARDGSRPGVAEATRDWIARFGINHTKLVLERDKATYWRQHKLDYVIEDSPSTAEKAHRQGLGVFLVDHPYNRHIRETSRLWRVATLLEIPALLRADWDTQTAKRAAT